MEHPSQVDQVGKPLGVIVVHVCEEGRIEFLWVDAQLRQPHCRPPAYVELQFQVAAAALVVSVAD
jgi:hypothetical protein